FDQFKCSGKDGRLEHLHKQLVCEEPHPILGLAFVTFKEEVVKNFSAILIADREQGDAEECCRALGETAKEIRLVSRIEAERVNQIRTNQCPFQVVECCRCHPSASEISSVPKSDIP